MTFADNLRNELKTKNEEIIATSFEPRKDELFNTIASGIKRMGYVKIDTFNHTGTMEGSKLGISRDEIDAFAEWLGREGFRVQKAWWGYSSEGMPDMLTIRV